MVWWRRHWLFVGALLGGLLTLVGILFDTHAVAIGGVVLALVLAFASDRAYRTNAELPFAADDWTAEAPDLVLRLPISRHRSRPPASVTILMREASGRLEVVDCDIFMSDDHTVEIRIAGDGPRIDGVVRIC